MSATEEESGIETDEYLRFCKAGFRMEMRRTKQGGALFSVTIAGMTDYIGVPRDMLNEFSEACDLASKTLNVWNKRKARSDDNI